MSNYTAEQLAATVDEAAARICELLGRDDPSLEILSGAAEYIRFCATVGNSTVPNTVYESAVRGRADFRAALRVARDEGTAARLEGVRLGLEAAALAVERFRLGGNVADLHAIAIRAIDPAEVVRQ